MMNLNKYYFASGDRIYGLPRQHFYNEYQYKRYSDAKAPTKILRATSEGVRISTLWQMQVIADTHGIDIHFYFSDANDELYDEMLYSSDMSAEEVAAEYGPDNDFEPYFSELAALAAWYGCETMELKCLAKVLFYKYSEVKKAADLPTKEFQSLYSRLLQAGYTRCAEWLKKRHFQEIEVFVQNDDNSLILKPKFHIFTDPLSRNSAALSRYGANEALEWHLGEHVLPKYTEPQTTHLLETLKRANELAEKENAKRRGKKEPVDIDLLVTAIFFHTLTLNKESETGLQYNVRQMICEDEYLTKIFTPAHIDLICMAIQELKEATIATCETIYGKLLIAASTPICKDEIIHKTYLAIKNDNPHRTIKENLSAVYDELRSLYVIDYFMEEEVSPEMVTQKDIEQLSRLKRGLNAKLDFMQECTRLIAGCNLKKILYIDIDGVLADFDSLIEIKCAEHAGPLEEVQHLFCNMEPSSDAIKNYQLLAEKFDTYILITAPNNNPAVIAAKSEWVKKNLGETAYSRLIVTQHRHLLNGDILIDTRKKQGDMETVGVHVRFSSASSTSWRNVWRAIEFKSWEWC